ncbi:hypothetical protein HZC33_00595 [Candidatus Wolfebacteria bacterium]|nr:hypothetical protein [Candidatus Wolfebacteria bacterium]
MNNYFKKNIILAVIFLISAFYFLISIVYAATNIDSASPNYYAWNDLIGWIDFYSTGNVNVSSAQLTGYASSSVGYIALDCATSPNGNICATSNFKVSNDGSGNLTGWAYNDNIGWISFDSSTATSTYPYQVAVNSGTGDFSGWAWNDNIGWISFNCSNSGAGGCTYPYKVRASWTATSTSGYLISSVFDSFGSSAINSIIWQGTQPSGTAVRFQLASSNSSNGPWNYMGPDGSSTTYYSANPGVSMAINTANHNNQRYFRYKVILYSDASQTLTPTITNIIINWSP